MGKRQLALVCSDHMGFGFEKTYSVTITKEKEWLKYRDYTHNKLHRRDSDARQIEPRGVLRKLDYGGGPFLRKSAHQAKYMLFY